MCPVSFDPTFDPSEHQSQFYLIRSTSTSSAFLLCAIGVEVPLQHSRYPSDAFQREWLTHYLRKRRELLCASARGDVSNDNRTQSQSLKQNGLGSGSGASTVSGAGDMLGSVTALDVGEIDEQLERLLRDVQHFSVVRPHFLLSLHSTLHICHSSY